MDSVKREAETAMAPSLAMKPPSPWLRLFGRRVVRVVGIGLIIAAALLPLTGNIFYVRLGIEAMLFGILALSVDILLGVAGMLSLGQAAFFGLGAYVSALVLTQVGPSIWLAFGITIAVVGVFSTLIGAVAIRSSGVYFTLITFGVGEVLGKVATNLSWLGGSDGLLGVPVPSVSVFGLVELPLTNNIVFFYFVFTLVLALYFGVRRLLDTPFGAVLRGLHDNESRVPYLGYDPFRYKLAAFVLAAVIAGIGGMLYPVLRGFVGPNLFAFEISARAVVMALVGGIGTLIGGLAGGGLITFLESVTATLTERYLTLLGAIFVIFVLFCPDGLIGFIRRKLHRL